MSDLKCHYCGAECRVGQLFGSAEDYQIACRNADCMSRGPRRDTPEAAAAAHATVMPAPRWTSEPPKVPGWYWFRYEHWGVRAEHVSQKEIDKSLCVDLPNCRIPEPADAAEGGGL